MTADTRIDTLAIAFHATLPLDIGPATVGREDEQLRDVILVFGWEQDVVEVFIDIDNREYHWYEMEEGEFARSGNGWIGDEPSEQLVTALRRVNWRARRPTTDT